MQVKNQHCSIKYSFIIPVKEINDYIYETVSHIQDIRRSDWELLIIPDFSSKNIWDDGRIKIYPSEEKKGPALKRDYGASVAKGEILVFLDDDSYPNNNVLDIADKFFENLEIIALGGPGITPINDTFWQKVSGAVFLSRFSGGAPERYQSIGSGKRISDWPSVNLMVRKAIFYKVGGFDTQYWPGEDSLFCQKLEKLNSGYIYYVPQMIVWHHRRAGLNKHLKQISAYALHRGYFAKKYRGNSLKAMYFVPTLFSIFCLISPIFLFLDLAVNIIKLLWSIYFIAILVSVIEIYKYHSIIIALTAIPYIILTHFYYGINFARGLLTKNVISKLR